MSRSPIILRWRLGPGLLLAPKAETELALTLADGRIVTLKPSTIGLRDALLALVEGADEARLLTLAGGGGGGGAMLHHYIAKLAAGGIVEVSADDGAVPLIRLIPHQTEFLLPRAEALPQRVMLNRFAYLRRSARGAILQHPDAPFEVLIEDEDCRRLITGLASGPCDICSLTGTLDHALLALLVSPGFVVDADAQEPPARQSWEFHDRLFHRTTRSHNDRLTRAGTYRFLDQWPAPPAIRPHYQGQRIALPRPASMPTSRSSSLCDVMENRRSRRGMSAQPVSIEDISLLMHRVARVKEVHSRSQSMPHETLLRPYPSAGAIHELEFYLAIRSCDRLNPGFYHYRGQEHALTLISNAETAAAGMVAECAASFGQPGQPPHAVMVITSRLPRLAWKYTGIAYRMSLLNAGVVIQSLYLTAADLGLVGCAIGTGNSELFAQATGASSWEETSIAEFGFGRPP
jgi:SagB-type dehydrogenase family enzyme